MANAGVRTIFVVNRVAAGIPNLGGLITGWDTTDYGVGHGGMVEGFCFYGSDDHFSRSDWELQMDRIVTLVRNNRIVLCQTSPAHSAFAFHVLDHSGLQARERDVEVTAPHHGTRESYGRRIALLGQARDHRPAGIPEPEQLGHLVKRLAGRIVERATEDLVATPRTHVHEHRVTARNK